MTSSPIQRYAPSTNGGRPASQATSIEQSRAIADVQAAVTVAQNCPRDMADAEREMEYVCGRLSVAEQAFYRVVNRGTGPSVHLMRELARIWGNIDYGVKELSRDDYKGESEVLATCWDMQKNTRSSRTFIVPHARMAAGARSQLTDLQDIYLNNQNIGARAVRECIETVLPRWFTERAQELCRATLANGEGEPLTERIQKMVDWFRERHGVSQQQLEASVGRGRGEWTADDVAQLKISGKSIMAGEISRDEAFPPITAATLLGEGSGGEGGSAGSALSGKVKDAATQQVSEPGQDGGNDASQGAEPSSGAESPTDSRDQETPLNDENPPTGDRIYREPESPAASPNKRDSKRSQQAEAKAAKGTQIEGKPKGHTDRVEAALTKAKSGKPEAAPSADSDTQDDAYERAMDDARDAAESAVRLANAAIAASQVPEPSDDPAEPEPPVDDVHPDDAAAADEQEPITGDDPNWVQGNKDAVNADADSNTGASAELDKLRAEVAESEHQAAAPAPEAAKAPTDWDGAKPATKEQLQELAQCIAAAGWQPTAEGRAQWFAWLSQEVGRDVTANNQLSRKEITQVITSMKNDAAGN